MRRSAMPVPMLLAGVAGVTTGLLVGMGAQRTRIRRERQRIARDLHDGALQELGIVIAAAREPVVGGAALRDVEQAAERALLELRDALTALSTRHGDVATRLRAVAGEIAERHGVVVATAIEDKIDIAEPRRGAVLRIATEALLNAVRHAAPTHVQVTLAPGLLEVRDDGKGFDVAHATRPGHLGLVSMKERAQEAGLLWQLTSAAGTGTTVRVTW